MVSYKSNARGKIPHTAIDALLGVLLSCLSKKVGKEGHPVVSPFGYPSFSKQESREIDGRVGDETSLRPRPRACMLGALRRAKRCFADSGFALSSAASVGRPWPTDPINFPRLGDTTRGRSSRAVR